MTPRENAERFLAAHKRRETIGDAYRRLFDTPDGKLVLADLLKEGRLFDVSVEAGDPLTTGLNDGRRALALVILERLRWSEMEILALSRERTAGQIDALQGED